MNTDNSKLKTGNSPVPEAGWTTPAEITRVIDGDTVEVAVTRRIRVRLLDCWAPELRRGDPLQRAAGEAAKRALQSLLGADSGRVLLQIPSGEGQQLSEVFSFGRVLGRLFLGDGREVSQLLVDRGFARREK